MAAKIYTRKGDDGTTSLWYGGRVQKNDSRTEAYGALDEANSALGVARALCDDERLHADIVRLQEELFIAGAELATAPQARERLEAGVTALDDEMVAWMEEAIDGYMAEVDLPPNFVIPGGTLLSAQLDVGRAVLRRAERRIAVLVHSGELDGSAVPRYVNRASDLVWAMSRYADEPNPKLFEGRARSREERS